MPRDIGSRKNPRYEAVMPAILKVPGGQGRIEEVSFSTRDISAAGLCMELDRPLPEGESFEAELALPGDTLVSGLTCEVRWCQKLRSRPPAYRIGVAFPELSAEQEKDLSAFFRELLLSRWGTRG